MTLEADYPNLDAETIGLLTELTSGDPLDITALPREEARAIASEYLGMMAGSWNPPECSVQPIDLNGPASGLLIRPKKKPHHSAPLVIWFHGGGWIFGSAALHVPYGREFAARAECLVAEVDYPLSPETRGRELIDICISSTEEIIRRHQVSADGFLGIGKKRRPVIVGGESAGATLALFVGQALGAAIVDRVVVANPLVDFRRDAAYESRVRFGDDRIMQSWPEFDWFIDQFAVDADRGPLSFVTSDFQSMPPTSILLGEYDMLLDEGLKCAEAIRKDRGTAESQTISGAIHNSIEFGPNTLAGERFISAISYHLSLQGQIDRGLVGDHAT